MLIYAQNGPDTFVDVSDGKLQSMNVGYFLRKIQSEAMMTV